MGEGHGGPSVSAVITCFNDVDVVVEAVASALAQTAPELIEVIVVDDGSTDDSAAVVTSHFGGDARLRVIRRDNGGPSAARNQGIAEAAGDWVALLDADDLWEPTRIEASVAAITANPGAGLIYSDFLVFTETSVRTVRVNEFRGHGELAIADLLTRGGPIVPTATTLRRDLVNELGGFDESLRSAEDADMWLRILAAAEIVRIPESLARKRDDPSSLGKNASLRAASMEKVVAKAVATHPGVAGAGRRRTSRSLSVQARQAARAGRITEAVVSAVQSVRRHPFSTVAWLALAQALTVAPWSRLASAQHDQGRSRPSNPDSNTESSR